MDSTLSTAFANKTLKKTKYSQTGGYFIVIHLLIPIIPKGIEHILLFH